MEAGVRTMLPPTGEYPQRRKNEMLARNQRQISEGVGGLKPSETSPEMAGENIQLLAVFSDGAPGYLESLLCKGLLDC